MPATPFRPCVRTTPRKSSPCAPPRSRRPARAVQRRRLSRRQPPPIPALPLVGEENLSKSERPELTSAKIIISGGRAMQNREKLHYFYRASCRPAWRGGRRLARGGQCRLCANDWQIGRTRQGRGPGPLYRRGPFRCYSASRRYEKNWKLIVAIDKDEEAPIFQVADYDWWRTFIRPCRSWPSSKNAVVDLKVVCAKQGSEYGRSEGAPEARAADRRRRRPCDPQDRRDRRRAVATASRTFARSPGFMCCSMTSSPTASVRGLPPCTADHLARQVSRQRITDEEREAALKRISPAKTLAHLGDCDLVIEARFEKEEVKRKSSVRSAPGLKPERPIVGTNTSSVFDHASLRLDRPAGALHRHSFRQSDLRLRMELVEVIRGIATDDETFATTAVHQNVGKQIAVSEDFPAFIVNRDPVADDQ